MGRNSWRALLAGVSCALIAAVAWSVPPDYDERPRELKTPTAHWDYEYRSAKIPMRDGVKLHTVILVPKGVKNAPILLTRTPYDAEGMTSLHPRSRLAAALDGYDHAAEGKSACSQHEVFIALLADAALELIQPGASADNRDAVAASDDRGIPGCLRALTVPHPGDGHAAFQTPRYGVETQAVQVRIRHHERTSFERLDLPATSRRVLQRFLRRIDAEHQLE